MPSKRRRVPRTFREMQTRAEDKKIELLRKTILRRDRYKCQFPGCTHIDKRLQVHHIYRYVDNPIFRENPKNLITLCRTHHDQIKNNEGMYCGLFTQYIAKTYMEEKKLVVIADTREQNPWKFARSKTISDIKTEKLDTGDYSIEGYEDRFAIERKASTGEIYKNMTEKRFVKCLERMQMIQHKFIICEFPFSNILDFPNNSGIPDHVISKLKMTNAYIMKYVTNITVKYGIPILFCDGPREAELMADSIIKRVIEYYEED